MSKKLSIFITLTLAIGILIGCSGTSPPTLPGVDENRLGASPSVLSPGHNALGIWDVLIDYDGVTITPVTERYLSLIHFNVKAILKAPTCEGCLSIVVTGNDEVNQILSADVTIKNPFPVEGADPRGIVMSNNPDVYLANPDDYTTFWDLDDPPDINPFRRFAKELQGGIVGQDVEVTESFDIHYDAIPFMFQTALDVIFPADSEREPYLIENQIIDGALDSLGGLSRKIEVDIFDRNENVGTVSVTSVDLGIDMTLIPDTANEDRWYGWVMNGANAGDGEYDILIHAGDQETEWFLYDYITVTVNSDQGGWEITQLPIPGGACATDLSASMDMDTGMPAAYYPGGDSCDAIMMSDMDFVSGAPWFMLVDIDPLNAGFNPYPIRKIDVATSGGVGFFADNDEMFDDGFYNGPVSSRLVTLFPAGMGGTPAYINNGDGDSSRMYPSVNTMVGIDVTDDMMGNIIALWADPDGVLPPEIYGLMPDYTRHDVIMGGTLPPELVGDGPGLVSANADNLIALEVGGLGIETGFVYILESDGVTSELEVIEYLVDPLSWLTSFTSITTIIIDEPGAVDVDMIQFNPLYLPNPAFDTLAILVQGGSGPIVKMYNSLEYTLVEEIGYEVPIITGNAIALDADNMTWALIVINDTAEVSVLRWVF